MLRGFHPLKKELLFYMLRLRFPAPIVIVGVKDGFRDPKPTDIDCGAMCIALTIYLGF
jgi:hypothetical protein